MTAQTDPRDLADALSGNLHFMNTLLTAAQNDVHFYLSDQTLLGPYRQFLSHQARELENLLALAQHFLGKMDRDLDGILDFLYETAPPQTAR